ncbi:BgtE-20043 [Blumeria graminis f. sp. tritici]|uniref:BgtE-20043 n=2 Tax=Blumeria graminis f. sp. tritici TaxID=62690 RepID=A0A381L5V6_BLUGR|nr:BgtE-20043 [Blumeria graminis f. sp. tritici]
MQLLSATRTAALAGLLLQLLTAHGYPHYQCEHGELLSVQEIIDLSVNVKTRHNQDDHPAIPSGQPCKSYTISGPAGPYDETLLYYLIQVYGQPPKIQFSQKTENGWKECSIINLV